MKIPPTVALMIAAAGLGLLSLARGAGGTALLLGGRSTLDAIRASDATARAVGLGLVLVSLLALFAAVRIARRHRQALGLGFVALSAFVVDGLANGALLFGRPTDAGTMVNVVVASAIGLALYVGRAGLQSVAVGDGTKS